MISVVVWFLIISFVLVFIYYFTPLGLKRITIRDNSVHVEQYLRRDIIPISEITSIQMLYTTDRENIERKIKGVIIVTDKKNYNLTSNSGFLNKLMKPDFDYNIIPQILARNPRIQTSHDLRSYTLKKDLTQVYLYHHQALYGVGVLVLLFGLIILFNTLEIQGYF